MSHNDPAVQTPRQHGEASDKHIVWTETRICATSCQTLGLGQS
jgi:hypothetical protein